MLLKLRLKIIERYGTCICAARNLGIAGPRLSLILNEHVSPNPSEREILIQNFGAKALRASSLARQAETDQITNLPAKG